MGGQARRIADRGIFPRYSPDGAWISFFKIPAFPETNLNKMFLIPGQGGNPIPFQAGFCIVNPSTNLGPVWSPDGSRLYYVSERDGFCCVWTQKLNPQTKQPDGDTEGVYHAHQARFTLKLPRGNSTVAVAADKLAIWMSENTDNIYMAIPKQK